MKELIISGFASVVLNAIRSFGGIDTAEDETFSRITEPSLNKRMKSTAKKRDAGGKTSNRIKHLLIMEMPLHNFNFLCTAMERTNTHKEEKLGKPQTLSSTYQTAINPLITSLCCTKSSFLSTVNLGILRHGNRWPHNPLCCIHISNQPRPPGAKPFPSKRQGCGTCQNTGKHTPRVS